MTGTQLYNELLNNGEISADNIDFDPMDYGYEMYDEDKELYREVEE